MICGPLGSTGIEGLPLLIAAVLAFCFVVGGILMVRTQRRRRNGTGSVAAAALLAAAALGLGTAGTTTSPASASVIALTITQTSVLTGFTPGDAPLPIFGTVTNNCDDDTFITNINVSIVGVTLAANAPAGVCTVADFVLLDPVMPVNAALPARSTVAFSGASLGLVDAAWNQDACQSATVDLLYVTP